MHVDPTRHRARPWALLLTVVLAVLALGPAGAAGAAGAATASSGPDDPTSASSGPAPSPPPDPRIVGGTRAAPGEFPSQVALIARNRTSSAGQFCGGTVIDRSWVMTAAHCVTGDDNRVVAASGIDILVGTTSLLSGGSRIPVVEVRRHPSYNPSNLRSDVAVLRLDRPVPYGTPIQALATTDPAAGSVVRVIGWGDLGNGAYPNDLYKVDLDIRSQSTCASRNPPYFSASVNICAFRYAKGDCYGDSGGPLLQNRSGTWVQVGIVSWGFECAYSDSVYARVSALGGWAKQQTRYGAQPNAASFVRRQYLDLFGRQPTNTELFYAVVGLEDGQSPSAYVDTLLQNASFQARTGGVIRLYEAIFLRRAETGGLTYWVREANCGVSLKRIADLMVGEPEFVNRYGTLDNGEFVDLVYENVLDRAPSPADRAYWTSELSSGRRTRGQVMVGFSESAEYKAATGPVTSVTATFFALLRRAPTGAELTQRVGRPSLETTTFVLTSFSYANRF